MMFGNWWICQRGEKLLEASRYSRSKQMPRDLWNVSKHELQPRVFLRNLELIMRRHFPLSPDLNQTEQLLLAEKKRQAHRGRKESSR